MGLGVFSMREKGLVGLGTGGSARSRLRRPAAWGLAVVAVAAVVASPTTPLSTTPFFRSPLIELFKAN